MYFSVLELQNVTRLTAGLLQEESSEGLLIDQYLHSLQQRNYSSALVISVGLNSCLQQR